MEDTGVPRENVLHVLVANHRYILCCIEYTSPWTWFDLTTFRHYWSTICFQFKFQWYPSYNKKRFCLFEVLTLMFHCFLLLYCQFIRNGSDSEVNCEYRCIRAMPGVPLRQAAYWWTTGRPVRWSSRMPGLPLRPGPLLFGFH